MLAEETVLQKMKLKSPEEVRGITLWSLGIQNIDCLKSFRNLKIVSLTDNCIESLAVFRHCPNLHELYLRKNKIASLEELAHLRDLKHLKVLWVSENPVDRLENYRLKVIQLLPQLYKLDEENIRPEERQAALSALRRADGSGKDEDMFERQPAPEPAPRESEFFLSEVKEKNRAPSHTFIHDPDHILQDQSSSQLEVQAGPSGRSQLSQSVFEVAEDSSSPLPQQPKVNRWKSRPGEPEPELEQPQKSEKISKAVYLLLDLLNDDELRLVSRLVDKSPWS